MLHRSPPQAAEVVAEHRRAYDQLVEIVRRHADRGDVERVLRSATMAAAYAWWASTGMLADPVLERLVVDAVQHGQAPVVDGRRTTGRVLHVLSEGYDTGGHTRLAWRWISRDSRVGDVALTNQRVPVPPELRAAVEASGGALHDLRHTAADLLDRAVALRELFDHVDLVVLHVHPYDAVALAAAALPGTRPPIVLENHADHAFWLGVTGADVVSEFRSGTRLSTELRGITPERIGVLPLPIETPRAPTDTAALRRQLGIADDAVVALTVASTAKVAAPWGRGMAPLLDRALTWSAKLTVVLAGVHAAGEWADLAARHPGRLIAVGPVPDPDPWYALADVYLDSYPTRAGTSVLEAALAGKPVLTIQDIPPTSLVHNFQADSPGLAGRPRVATREQYVTALRRLVDDPELRAREGALVQAAVRSAHQGTAWTTAMEDLYARARQAADAAPGAPGERVVDEAYGAMLAAFNDLRRPMASVPVAEAARPLGELFDDASRADVFAVQNRAAGPSLAVRVAQGWEQHEGWTTRLLALARSYPRLRVSLPFLAGDDVEGSATTAVLVAMLAAAGQTPQDCGDINVESSAPRAVVPAVAGELPCSPEALDWLESVLASPCWEPLAADDRPEPVVLATA